jgi:hypothetical protein
MGVFWGSFSFNEFWSINLMLAVNMVIVSLIAIKFFRSYWVSLLLIVSVSNFLNEIIPVLSITSHTEVLSTITTLIILLAAYRPQIGKGWDL